MISKETRDTIVRECRLAGIDVYSRVHNDKGLNDTEMLELALNYFAIKLRSVRDAMNDMASVSSNIQDHNDHLRNMLGWPPPETDDSLVSPEEMRARYDDAVRQFGNDVGLFFTAKPGDVQP